MVPPTEPCALRSTQLLKVSTRDLTWGKGDRCVWLTTYYLCSAETSKSGALIYPEPFGPPRPVAEHLYTVTSSTLDTCIVISTLFCTIPLVRSSLNVTTFNTPINNRLNYSCLHFNVYARGEDEVLRAEWQREFVVSVCGVSVWCQCALNLPMHAVLIC